MECWKSIEGFPGYEVSNMGNVRSLDRLGPDGRRLKGKVLSPVKVGRGYLTVSLRKDGETIKRYVHRLVGQHFLKDFVEEKTINHINGVKTDNKVENLECVTYAENNQHAYDNGLHGKGENHYRAKLTEEQVKEIKRAGKGENTYNQIAERYGVSASSVRDILIGKTWKSIEP